MFKKLFIFLVFLALLVGVSAALPPKPCEFYGTVTTGAGQAPAGTVVTANVFGTNHGQITTTQLGKYGGPNLNDNRLQVSLTEAEYEGCLQSPGCSLLIEFYVNGKKAAQTAVFQDGGGGELNLTVSGSAPPTTTPTYSPTPTQTTSPTPSPTATVTPRPTSIPQLPQSFYGTATLQDGAPAPAGTEIKAIVPGVILSDRNPITVVTPGIYGGTGINDKRLEVQGYIETGAPIQFYIGGSLAEVNDGSGWMQSYPYTPGATTELDLRTNVTGPIANFAAQPVNGYEPLMVQFMDLSSGPPTSWHWEFGDGTTADIQNPLHRYYNGKYTVSLTISNAAGYDTLTQINYINVFRQSSPAGGGGGGGPSGGYYAVGSTPTPTGNVTPTATVTQVPIIPGGILPLGSNLALTQSVVIASSDNSGTISMVAGTVPKNADGEPLLTLTIRRMAGSDVPPVPSGASFSYAGYAYEIEPSGATFDPYATLAITVSENDWAGLQGRQLSIKWYNPATSAWEDIPTSVDQAGRMASARITHTSIFALFAENLPTTIPTSAPTTAPPPFPGLSYFWIVAIVIVVVAVILVVIVIMRRKWSREEGPSEEENWKME
jgi:PKD repeat protein